VSRWTEADLEARRRRLDAARERVTPMGEADRAARAALNSARKSGSVIIPTQEKRAAGRDLDGPLVAASEPSREERSYAELLERRRLAGEVRRWRYQPVSLRLGARLWYRPDFGVLMADRTWELHEVKGGKLEAGPDGAERCVPYTREDAAVKIRAAASAFPWWRFVLAWRWPARRGGAWCTREVPVDGGAVLEGG
jgi:hypothetical protein